MSDFSSKIEEIRDLLQQLNDINASTNLFKDIIFNNKKKENVIRGNVRAEISAITKKIENSLTSLATPSSGSDEIKTSSDSDVSRDEFSDFLYSIGESVVASQEKLDEESINYLKRLKGNDTNASIIPPSVFRIPKLKASLKLGIEKTEGSKLNVLIYGKEKNSKMINQQSVELEIISVPASAELLQNLEGKTPQIQFVLSSSEREDIFRDITTAVASQGIKKAHYGDMLEDKNKTRVIFWRTTKSKSDTPDTFLVLYAGKSPAAEKPRHVCMWQLTANKKKSKMQPIIRYDIGPQAVTGQDQGLLHDFVTKIANSQMTLLKS